MSTGADMRRERAPFFIAYSNETQSSGSGVADRTRIAEGHGPCTIRAVMGCHRKTCKRQATPRAPPYPAAQRQRLPRRRPSRSLPDAPPTCGIGQNAGHLRLRKAT